MKKFFLATTALVALSAPAFAIDPSTIGCNPATGNWVGAAPITCPGSAGGAEGSFLAERLERLAAKLAERAKREARDDYKS